MISSLFFQAVDERKMRKDFADGTSELNFVDSYEYDLAAYNIAELVGLDSMMPVTVQRSWNVNVVHLGLNEDATDETKSRYAFVYGDFRRVHRTGLIACHYRAAEWRHKEIELAAHNLLQLLDKTTA